MSTAPQVDGYSVHVPNAYALETMSVFEAHDLAPFELDGRTGYGIEREIAAGSIDGDDPQDLATFADVLDALDAMNTPYSSADILAAKLGKTEEVSAYMSTRGRLEILPTRDSFGRHDGHHTGGDYEISTQY